LDISGVDVPFINFYPTDSDICNIDRTKEIFEDVALPGYFVQFNVSSVLDITA